MEISVGTLAAHGCAVVEWQQEVDAARAGAEAELQERGCVEQLEDFLHIPPGLVAPVELSEAPSNTDFHFPEVWTGYVFLRAYGVSPEQKASLLRGTSGSTKLLCCVQCL